MANFDDLRQRAEDELKERVSVEPDELSAQYKDHLIEELRIHQVELEIQNGQLREAQEGLERSREQYIELYDAAPVGYFTLDPAGLILAANLTGADQLGQARRALLQQRFISYVAEESRDTFYLHLRRCMITQARQTCELELVTANGSPFTAQLESTPAVNEVNGIPQIRTIVIDITARKQLETDLDQHRQHLEGMVAVRTEELSRVNERLQAEIGERSRAETILADSKLRLEQTLAELQATQEQVIRQERLAAVGHLAAGIAHDFNNILTGITGHAELLKLRAADFSPDDLHSVKTIIKQSERAAHLIRQVLDFTRKSIRQPRSLDLGDFLQTTLAFLQRTIPETIQLRLQIGSGPFLVQGDSAQLQQLLTNLAVNARDAMPEAGLIEFHLSRLNLEPDDPPPCPEMPPGHWICLAVSDTGTGIPADILSHIFEPFFTTKDIGQGTGLGLAQVYGIVKQHDGCIDVTSRVGAGTTFSVYLPPGPATVEQPAPPLAPEPPHGQGEVVLVVEDDPVVLSVISALLKMLNYTILKATNGQEALQVYRANRAGIAVVLADLVMPELDGIGLLRALQADDPQVKIIIMSGYPQRGPVDELIAEGVMEWVQKPPRLNQLAHALRRTL